MGCYLMHMPCPGATSSLSYISLAVLIVSQLPRWGQSVLAFLRDLDDYRSSRSDHS